MTTSTDAGPPGAGTGPAVDRGPGATATARTDGTGQLGGPGGDESPSALDGLVPVDRRRLRRAWWAGSAPVLALYGWIITVGRLDLFQRNYFDDFYDAQARALFHGRLDVPREVVSFEGFLINGRTYMYFGPVPAVLRMPILAITDRLDGRLTILSMLAATVVLAIAAFRLACVLRAAVRGAAPVGRREPLATAALAVAVLGAPPLFLASSAVVYHEAAIWGLALAVAGFDAVARWQRSPTRRRLVIASALITLAILSRQSVGFGPLVALAISAAVTLARRDGAGGPTDERRVDPPGAGTTAEAGRRRRWRRARPGGRAGLGPLARRALPLGIAVLVPFGASVGLNYAKFGTLLTPPAGRHLQSLLYPEREEVLAEHGGSLFDIEFAPTTTKQYLRPDGIDVRRDFPWIDFPRLGPSRVGDTRFDALDWTSSLPASAPALTVGALAAAVWAVRARRRRAGPVGWRLAALCAGAAAGGAGVIAVGYVANRYLNDLYPLALVPGVIGFHVLAGAAPSWRPRRKRLVAAGAAGLVGLGLVANTALALSYQRERGPVVPEPWRAQWVSWRLSLPGAYEAYVLPEGSVFLPRSPFDGRLAIVGHCQGMYVRVGDRWKGVERGPGVGVHELRVDLDRLPPGGQRFPLATFGSGSRMTIVALARVDADHVRVDVSDPPGGRTRGWHAGDLAELGGTVTIRVEADPRDPPSLILYRRRVLNGNPVNASSDPPRYGRAPAGYGVAEAYPDGVELVAFHPDLCHEALARTGGKVPEAIDD